MIDSVLPPSPTALTAFLRGIEPRAFVLALSQCGDPDRADAALEAALHDFVAHARTLPLAQWPLRFWTGLLKQPAMLSALEPGLAFAQFSPGPRAALLLRLVAGLDIGHAAQVLDVSAAAYQEALGQALAHPDLDDARMQALREHLHAQIHQLPPERRQALAELREKALLQRLAAPAHAGPELRPAHRRGWLWLLLAGLVLALTATFLWPVRALLAPGQSEALPLESIPPPPTLTDAVIVTHPDYEQLANPADDVLAQQLAFLSWVAAGAAPASTAEARPAAAPPVQELEDLPAAEQTLLSSARAAWPVLDAATRAALLRHARDWQSRAAGQRGSLRDRLGRWDGQAAADRARRRTPFLAWQRLTYAERLRVRAAARTVAARPAAEQQLLRGQFAALPDDTQRLWWMGPALGRELAPIASLFAFMPEAERPALLAALGTLDAAAREDLAVLAPRLSEARRQALRKDLLATPPARRPGLIRQRLAQ